jgi:septal ring factor EnvC (AmiA/AmiB activator)
MKRSHWLSFLIVAGIVISATAADSDSRDDERWQSDRATNELLERQKQLLDRQDKLAVQVQDLKKEINHLSTELSHSQSDLDEVRHELIILRVKLLP